LHNTNSASPGGDSADVGVRVATSLQVCETSWPGDAEPGKLFEIRKRISRRAGRGEAPRR
jgi:hypothetical protein